MSDWKYDLDEVGEDADGDADAPVDADAPADANTSADAEFDPVEAEPIEPGSPTLENALFVALGVATTLFVFAQVILLASG